MFEAGYIKEVIYHTPAQKKYFINHYHHYIYRKDELGLILEVHWKLFNDYMDYPLSVEEMIAEADTVDLGGFHFRVLSDLHLVIYLFSDGAIHSWYRLFWLRDVARLMKKNPDWETIFKSADKMKNIRPVIQGILLSHHLFGTSIPRLPDNFNDKRVISNLVLHALKKIQETTAKPFNMLYESIYFSQLKKSLIYKIKCFTFLTLKPEIWTEVQLPDSLFFLYYFVRPVIWYRNIFKKFNKNREKITINNY